MGGVEALARLSPVEVLDVVLAEVDNPYQPTLANRLRADGWLFNLLALAAGAGVAAD